MADIFYWYIILLYNTVCTLTNQCIQGHNIFLWSISVEFVTGFTVLLSVLFPLPQHAWSRAPCHANTSTSPPCFTTFSPVVHWKISDSMAPLAPFQAVGDYPVRSDSITHYNTYDKSSTPWPLPLLWQVKKTEASGERWKRRRMGIIARWREMIRWQRWDKTVREGKLDKSNWSSCTDLSGLLTDLDKINHKTLFR